MSLNLRQDLLSIFRRDHILGARELLEESVIIVPRNDMHVRVEDDLARGSPVILENVYAVAACCLQTRERQEDDAQGR